MIIDSEIIVLENRKEDNMKEWYLFIVSIGLLIIASTPLMAKPMVPIIMGVVAIVTGGFMYMKDKKG